MVLPGREQWLKDLGLRFDPFCHFEASEDPRLFDYIVIRDDLLRKIWSDSHSFIFAPSGGGKTALWLYFIRACWLPPARGFPFPLPYNIPHFLPWDALPSIDQHFRAMLRAASSTFLTMLSLRPFLWEELRSRERELLVRFLNSTLPLPLSFYLDQLETARSPEPLFNSFGKALILSGTSPRIEGLLKGLRSTSFEYSSTLSTKELWEIFLQLAECLGFTKVYLLTDGVDFSYETQTSSDKVRTLLGPLVEAALELEKHGVFLKVFLPNEHTASAIEVSIISSCSGVYIIEWDEILLTEVIRKRLLVASDGYIESLDALSSYPLHDLDSLIMQNSPALLPRTVIHTISTLFDIHIKRAGPQGLLDLADVEFLLAELKKRL